MKFRREAGHGGVMPRGWRMAWYEPQRRVGVYFPAPLHRILRMVRELAYRVRIAAHAPSLEIAQVFEMQRTHRERQHLADEYARGYLAGWRECLDTCLETVSEEIGRADVTWEVGGLLAEALDPPCKN
jgi:hypothetical protein